MTAAATNPWLMMALNNAWANSTLYGAVLPLGERWTDARPGFFGSIARTLNHVHAVDLFYVDALEEGGLGRSVFDAADVSTPAELAERQSGVDMRLAMFCQSLTPETLTSSRPVARPDGMTSESVAALLLHLSQHQVHHRGQVHAMLSDAGLEPPQLDDFYLDHNRAPSAAPYWS